VITVDIERLIAVQRSQLGYVEKPVNHTKYGQWYGMDGVAWCAIWESWCYDEAGARLPAIDSSKGFSLVADLYTYARDTKIWKGKFNPKRGDFVLYKFGGDRPANHVETIQAVAADGRLLTIGGNTNAAGSRTGGMVAEQYRRTGIVGYVDVTNRPAAIDWAALRRLVARQVWNTLTGCPNLHTGEKSLYVAVYKNAFNIVSGTKMVTEGDIAVTSTLDLAAAQINFKRWMNALGCNITDPDGICAEGTRWWLCVGLDKIARGLA
jgi:hypothetical protein